MGQPHNLRLKVRHYEVDVYGHVNHAHYVHYLETGRIEALEAIGLSIDAMKRQGYLIVAADLFIRYHSPARLGEELDVQTHIHELRGARSLWVQEIREASRQRVIVTAEVTGAFMTDNGRPARPPADFAEKLSAISVTADRPGRTQRRSSSRRGEGKGPAEASYTVDAHRPIDSPTRVRSWCLCGGGGLKRAIRGRFISDVSRALLSREIQASALRMVDG
jgi:YbgC/YbaW family acyl-CoA thioester hydrolase